MTSALWSVDSRWIDLQVDVAFHHKEAQLQFEVVLDERVSEFSAEVAGNLDKRRALNIRPRPTDLAVEGVPGIACLGEKALGPCE